MVMRPADLGGGDPASQGAILRLWVRPGQVQRFVRPGTANGAHLLFTPAFPPHASSADRLVTEWYGPACRHLGASPEYAVLSTLFGQMRAEYDRPAQTVSAEILQLLPATVLLQIDRLPHAEDGGDPYAGGEVNAASAPSRSAVTPPPAARPTTPTAWGTASRH
ncbi:hypothetical protein SMA5143A_0125 [Streptomyces sp. MA5143a]|nr:hypothetical protein SMA5143A_0125 [Streptomyces sp. MA5143a]